MPNSVTGRGTIRRVLEGPRSGWDDRVGPRVFGYGVARDHLVRVHGVMLTDWRTSSPMYIVRGMFHRGIGSSYRDDGDRMRSFQRCRHIFQSISRYYRCTGQPNRRHRLPP